MNATNPVINGDEFHLSNVIFNLLDHAIIFFFEALDYYYDRNAYGAF